MKPGLIGVLLITFNVVFVFPSPINYQENNNAVNKVSTYQFLRYAYIYPSYLCKHIFTYFPINIKKLEQNKS